VRSVSPEFVDAVRGSHLIAAKVELYFPDAPNTPVDVGPVGGSVAIDRTAQVRRTGSVVIPWSLERADELGLDVRILPLGGHAKVYRGVRFPTGPELVSLGRMRVESVTWSTVEQRATLELADSMAQVRDEPFEQPFVASGMRVAAAAQAIVQQVLPTVAVSVRYDPSVILADVIYTGSRLDALFELAKAVGAETWFDADDVWIFDVAAGGKAVKLTGTLTDGSSVVTGLSSTAELAVGMTVTGVGIPGYRRVAAINSATQITLNAPVNTWGIKNSRTTSEDNAYSTNDYEAAYRLTEVTDTDDLSPGMDVAGGAGFENYFQPGTKIDRIVTPSELRISKSAQRDGYPLVVYTAPSPAVLEFAGGASAYPVADVAAGEGGVLVDAGESLDRSGVYNGVLVVGQATAVTGSFAVLVVDSEPSSPARWGGPFGKVLRVEQTNAIQTATQGAIMGEALLNDGLGLSRSLTLAAAPNPALEAGDTVRVVFGDGRVETHLLDAVGHGLGPEPMRLATRSVAKPADLARLVPFPTRRAYYGADVWRELRHATVLERTRRRAA
jgi:hypothetical protein